MGSSPLGGIYDGGKAHVGSPLPWGAPLPAGMTARIHRGADGARTLLARSELMLA